MKKIFLFLALISITFFTACIKEEIDNDLVTNQESVALTTTYKTDNLDYDNSLLDVGKANFVVNNEDNTVFEKDVLLLDNNSVNAVSYHWDFGNGKTSTEAIPTHEYKIHGNYTVTLTITDSNGNKHQVSDDVLVLCLFGGGVHNQ